MSDEIMAELETRLAERRAELAEMKASLPAHTVRPHQMIQIEETEEEIAELQRQLTELREASGRSR
ncbi:MAG: hypothetical protein Kow00122_16230 [Thermoleophilia bacterium]